MRFIKSIELDNYLNVKHAKLDDLKDLNVIIGPNNCGKTSVLKSVELLGRLSFGKHGQISCSICRNSVRIQQAQDASGSINTREKYLTTTMIKAAFGFNKSEFEKIIPQMAERQNIFSSLPFDDDTRRHFSEELDKQQLVIKEQSGQLVSEHISIFSWDEVTRKIFGHIHFCPDERLQTYKGTQITEHIKSKNFDTEQNTNLISFLRLAADQKLASIRQGLDLVRNLE